MFVAAAAQFAASGDPGEKREKCLGLLDEAARGGADLVILPDFSHYAPVYLSGPQAHPHAVHPGHPFLTLTALRAGARRHRVWVVPNAVEQGLFPQVLSASFLLFGPERSWLTPARDGYRVFVTPFGRLGMFICMDALIPEPARCLALAGVDLVVHLGDWRGPPRTASAPRPQLHGAAAWGAWDRSRP